MPRTENCVNACRCGKPIKKIVLDDENNEIGRFCIACAKEKVNSLVVDIHNKSYNDDVLPNLDGICHVIDCPVCGGPENG